VTWLPVSDHGEVYALGASIQRHVRRSAAAHVQRLIIHATACPHPQVHRITRDFLTALVDGPGAPGLGTFLRRSGVAPRTAERIWSRAGLPHPKRFLDLTLLLFLATESARTGDTITHVARDSAGYHVPAGGGAGQGRVPGVQGGGRPVRSGHGRPAAEVHLVRGEYAAGAVRAAPRSRGSSARVHGKVAAVPPGVTPFAPPKPRTMSWRRSIRSRSATSRLSCC
jgi:hypothetical protein